MKEHSILARTRSRAWLKIALLVLLPLGLALAIRERASWRPRVMPGARANVFQVAFSPDGKYLAVAAQSSEPPKIFPDGHADASRKFDDGVDVWDAQGRTSLRKFRLPGQSLGSIAFSPDGHELAGLASWPEGDGQQHAGGHNTVKVWDVGTGKLKRSLPVEHAYSHHLYWTGDTFTFTKGQYVTQWDAHTGKHLRTIEDTFSGPSGAPVSPDGTLIATRLAGVELRQVGSGKLRRTLLKSSTLFANQLTFSRDGSLLVGCLGDVDTSTIKLWDTGSGAPKQTLRRSTSPRALALSPDNSTLATADEDNVIRLWNVADGTLPRTLAHSPAHTLAFSPDGSTLASGSGNGTFTLWRIK